MMDNVHIKDTEQFYLHNRSNKLTTLEVHVEKHTWIESKNTSFFFLFSISWKSTILLEKIEVPSYGLLIVPPVSSIKNNDICIPPF